MVLKRTIGCILFLFCLLNISGCVYLRLLRVKSQLFSFEKYFRIENQNGLTLIFLKPLLLSEDLLTLAKRGPTTKVEVGGGELWRYFFLKQYQVQKDESGDFDIPLDMIFQNNKLCKVKLPERFLRILPMPFIIGTLKEIGGAKIKTKDRYLAGNFHEKSPQKGMRLPRKQDFLRLLGKPLVMEESELKSKLTYRYRLNGTKPLLNTKPSRTWARVTFWNGDETLSKLEAKLGGMKFSITYEPNE